LLWTCRSHLAVIGVSPSRPPVPGPVFLC
jgi:hypothetical protein